MTDQKQTDQAQPFLQIDGRAATKEETRRILGAKAPASDPKERATKPIQTVSRPFKLLR